MYLFDNQLLMNILPTIIEYYTIIIDNFDTSRFLIYIDFIENHLTIHGTLHVRESVQLTPVAQLCTCITVTEIGLIYYDINSDGACICTRGSSWQAIN